MPAITFEDIKKYKYPCAALTKPVRGWAKDADGMKGADITIPAGTTMVRVFPDTLRSFLARHGDMCVGEFVTPDGDIVTHFYSVTAALKALPEDMPEVQWCTATQTYEPVA
jgi:hypothetical protein